MVLGEAGLRAEPMRYTMGSRWASVNASNQPPDQKPQIAPHGPVSCRCRFWYWCRHQTCETSPNARGLFGLKCWEATVDACPTPEERVWDDFRWLMNDARMMGCGTNGAVQTVRRAWHRAAIHLSIFIYKKSWYSMWLAAVVPVVNASKGGKRRHDEVGISITRILAAVRSFILKGDERYKRWRTKIVGHGR